MPDCLTAIPEVLCCFEIAQIFLDIFLDITEKARNELDTDTATEKGIERKEKMFGIVPSVTDTLEERRFRIQIKERIIRNMNFGNLERLIKDIAGEKATVERDERYKNVTVRAPLESEKNLRAVDGLCRKYVPVTMNCDISPTFNVWRDFSDKNFSSVSSLTYAELRSKGIDYEGTQQSETALRIASTDAKITQTDTVLMIGE